jgi:tetratricopeptide (TPR) repeat protein
MYDTEEHELWARLQSDPDPESQRRWVETEPECHSPAFCLRLCEESEEAGSESPGQAVHLAALALLAAELAPGTSEERTRLQSLAQGFAANADRVAGRLPQADEAFRRSHALALVSPDREMSDGDLLKQSRLLDLEASLRKDQRRLPEALQLLDRALTIAVTPTAAIRVLIKKGRVLEELGRFTEALEVLANAAARVDATVPLRLRLSIRFNTVANLWRLERCDEAAAGLAEVRALALLLNRRMDLLRVRWLEARIKVAQGFPEAGIEILRDVSRAFAALNIPYDSALASQELSVLLLEAGRTEEALALAREIAPILAAQGVEREALANYKIFRHAAERQAVSRIQALSSR